MGISASLFQAFLQHGAPDQCFHSCSTPPSAHPSRGEPVPRRPRPPRPVTFLHLHLGRPPGLQYRRAAPQGQGTLGPAHPAEHPAGRSRREGGVLNTPVPAPLGPVPTSPCSAAAAPLAYSSQWRSHSFIPLEVSRRPSLLPHAPTPTPPPNEIAPPNSNIEHWLKKTKTK